MKKKTTTKKRPATKKAERTTKAINPAYPNLGKWVKASKVRLRKVGKRIHVEAIQ